MTPCESIDASGLRSEKTLNADSKAGVEPPRYMRPIGLIGMSIKTGCHGQPADTKDSMSNIEATIDTDGKAVGVTAKGDGYEIRAFKDAAPVVTIDHSKARLNRLPESNGEVEVFEIVDR